MYVIGCDVGTQSVKAALMGFDGAVLAEASAEYAVHYPQPAWAEQRAEDWLNGLCEAIGELRQRYPFDPAHVHAICLATQVDGVVALARDGEPLRNAIIWMDRRATAECEQAARRMSPEAMFACSGLNLDASHVAPKIHWLAQHEPATYARANCFLLPGSYLAYALTGELAVDYSNASSSLLMNVSQRTWSDALCSAFEIDVQRLAPIFPATQRLGTLRPALAMRLGLSSRTQVMVGCGDEHAACVGAGVITPGVICDIAGTAEPVCAASPHPIFDATHLVETHCHADPALWLIENPGFVSGANYRWFRDEFGAHEMSLAAAQGGSAYALLNELAAPVPPGAQGLIFLPCLMGAMTPTWNANARGTFFGLTLAHTRGHMLRALLEASAYAVRDICDRMRDMGLPTNELRVVGGGAKGQLWRQIKADVTGLPVTVPEWTECTAIGAGMLALVGVGAFASPSEAAAQVVRIRERIDPRPHLRALYQESYELYRATYDALLPVFAQAAGNSNYEPKPTTTI